FFPPFVEIYAKLAQEFRIPAMVVRPDREALARTGLAAAEPTIRRAVELLGAAGMPVLDWIDADSLGFAPDDGDAHTRKRLDRLVPGVTYFITHPARDGEELRAIAPDHHARSFEHRFYGSEAGRAALAAAGVRTIGMRAIRDLMAQG